MRRGAVFSTRASAQIDQRLRCPPEDVLDPLLPTERPAKTDAQADLNLHLSIIQYYRKCCPPAQNFMFSFF